MKSKYLFYFLITLLPFVSCKKDDDSATIVGTWQLKSTTFETIMNGKVVESDMVEVGDGTLVLEFKADGTLTRTEQNKQPEIGKYQLNESQTRLATQYNGETGTLEVKRLTSRELAIFQQNKISDRETETNLFLLLRK